jgi:predicted RNA binding protein YcfA (HicA-like mRNA interferase family)
MPAIPSVRGERVVRALERAGFKVAWVSGSHHVMRSLGYVTTGVHRHRGTTTVRMALRGILADTGLAPDELRRLL